MDCLGAEDRVLFITYWEIYEYMGEEQRMKVALLLSAASAAQQA
jgi:hypothetical protein